MLQLTVDGPKSVMKSIEIKFRCNMLASTCLDVPKSKSSLQRTQAVNKYMDLINDDSQ